MPLDHRSLPSLVASPRISAEGYCPECGQSLTWRAAPTRTIPSRPGWSYLLLIAGAYLVVRYGPAAWSWYQELAHGADLLRAFGVDPRHVPTTFGWGPSMAYTTYAVAQDQLQGKLTGLVVGLLAVLVAAEHWLSLNRPRFDARRRAIPGLLVELHRSAESVLLGAFGLIFLGYAYLLVAQLVGGAPLSFDLADATATQVVDVLASLVRTIATGSSGPSRPARPSPATTERRDVGGPGVGGRGEHVPSLAPGPRPLAPTKLTAPQAVATMTALPTGGYNRCDTEHRAPMMGRREVGEGEVGLARGPGSRLDLSHLASLIAFVIHCSYPL